MLHICTCNCQFGTNFNLFFGIGVSEYIHNILFLHKATKAAFILILRRQNQRFETLIQNGDPKRR